MAAAPVSDHLVPSAVRNVSCTAASLTVEVTTDKPPPSHLSAKSWCLDKASDDSTTAMARQRHHVFQLLWEVVAPLAPLSDAGGPRGLWADGTLTTGAGG